MSPQGVMDLLVVHCPHSVAQNPGNIPTTIPIHQLSSPPHAQPKEWDPPSLPRTPQLSLKPKIRPSRPNLTLQRAGRCP
jgi:hypothetical protein